MGGLTVNIKLRVSEQGYLNVRNILIMLESLEFHGVPLLLRRDKSAENFVTTYIIVSGSLSVFSQNR